MIIAGCLSVSNTARLDILKFLGTSCSSQISFVSCPFVSVLVGLALVSFISFIDAEPVGSVKVDLTDSESKGAMISVKKIPVGEL